MSLLVGCRVIRGPDWNWTNQDGGDDDGGGGDVGGGGEYHLGTITALAWSDDDIGDDDRKKQPATAVKVTWDAGRKGNYRAGFQEKFDLRMTDNAPAGVTHRDTRCVGCDVDHIAGICWRCSVCVNCNLCTECYMSDCHDLDHTFYRVEGPHDPGYSVGARSKSERATVKGLLPGSKVTRGPDWKGSDQDGGRKKVGTVMDIIDWSGCYKRGGVLVKWDESGKVYRYQAGHQGKVEVIVKEASTGLDVYYNHLPTVGSGERWLPDESALVAMDTETIRNLHEETGESWDNSLVEKVGAVGKIRTADQRGWYEIVYEDGAKWIAPPFVFKKPIKCSMNDRVRISRNMTMVKELQPNHGGWSNQMKKSIGKEGTVEEVDDDGDVKVAVGGHKWTFHPAVLTSLEQRNSRKEEKTKEEDRIEGQEIENIIPNEQKPKPKPIPVPNPNPDAPAGHRDKVGQLMDLLGMVERLKATGIRDATGSAGMEKQVVRAAALGQLDKVKEYLKLNGKLANATYGKHTPLQVACHEGHLPVVQTLVEAHASLEDKDEDGDTALAFAVIGNNASITEYLLEQNTYVNTTNKRRRTPLHHSAQKGHHACAEILLKHGASVNMQDNDDNLPIHLAIRHDSTALLPLLINHPSADLKLRNSVGFTPLHYAAKKGCIPAVELIVDKDKSLCNIKKNDGFTPLHLAVANNHMDAMKILMKTSDCNIPTTERGGKATPLHLAIWQGHSAALEILVDHGVDMNAGDKDGDTALHLAVQRRHTGRKVVQGSPTLTQLCTELNNPAIASPRDTVLAYFIRHGSDVTIKNKSGKTALQNLNDADLKRSLMALAGIDRDDLESAMGDVCTKNGAKEYAADNAGEKEWNRKKTSPEGDKKKTSPTPEKKEAFDKGEKTRAKRKSVADANGTFEGIHRIDTDELDLQETVGRGGFGEVKRAVWRGTMVAVKIISTAGSKEGDVEKEISIHKRARHPNIVSLMAVGHRVGEALIVMEFINGTDLYDAIFKKKMSLPPELKLNIAVGLLSALTYLHASKILHLDIKPSNIMIESSSKRAYLCDLGLAHIKTRSSMCLSTSLRGPRGTITHMAPEMVERGEDGAWAGTGNDIWSIACTFLELFVGQRLWRGMEFLVLMRALLKPDAIPPIIKDASPEIRDILNPCFRRDPLTRPSAETLLHKFQDLQKS